MQSQVVTQPVTVTSLSGNVVVVNAQGQARIVNAGDVLQPDEIIITVNQSAIELQTTQGGVQIDENCVACLPEFSADGQPEVQAAPVQGQINLDLAQLDTANFDEQAIAAIQQAILDGVDPTTALEAAAAGAGAGGSANGGAITIDYNFLEVLASTAFDTQGYNQTFSTTQTLVNPLRFAAGGESLSTQVTEGSLSLGTYPQTSTVTSLITAGSLALLPASFVPEAAFLTSLLAELNQDITSSGQPVVFRYDAATNSIIGEQNGSTVLSIAISAESIGRDVNLTITTTLSQPIDHLPSVGGGLVSISGDQISIALQLTGTDSNGNVIQAPIDVVVAINDGSAPVMVDEPTLSLNENDLPAGSDGANPLTVSGQFDTQLGSDQVASYQIDPSTANPIAGLTSQGDAVILGEPTLIDGSRVYQATAGGRDIFQLTLNADGSYQFVLQGTLDHAAGSDALTISLPIVAIDYDNDSSAPGNLNIEIQDDKPIIIGAEPLTVAEQTLDTGSIGGGASLVADGNFTTTQGSDGVVSYRLDSLTDAVAGITSGGVAVTLSESVDANGNYTYTATAGGEPVFTLLLNQDGSYRFILQGSLDHALNSDELLVNFTVVATDFDGDTASITLPVTVKDDKPYFTNVTSLNVHENDLPQGSDVTKEPLTASGQFELVQGSDRVSSFTLDGSVNPVQGLTSNGVAVTLSAPVDDGNGNLTYTAMAGSVTVFSLTLNSDGTYSFTLSAPVDHALNSDSLTLNFKVIATDFDGDSDSIVLPVKINDDKPYFTNVQGLYVHENDLPQGSDTDKEPVTVNGQFQLVQGADTVASFTLDSSVNPVQGLTSNGVAVTLSAPVDDGHGNLTYTAMAGSVTVFTLTLNSDGTYSFTLAAPVDHALNSNDLTLNFKVIATDFDGDSDSIVLPVKINDDKPYFTNVQGLYVHENDLPQGSDTDKEPVTVNGQFQLVQGADTVSNFALDSSVNPVQGLTSNGVAVTLSAPVDDGHGNLTYTAMAGAVTVFTLTLNTDGTYSFTLAAPVDHALNSNDLTLNFKVIATDFDGDSDSIVLPVKINDDKPYFTNVQGLYVHENDLPQGSDTDKEPVTVNGQFQLVQGADTVASFALDSSVNPVQGLTSNGVAVTLSAPVDDGHGNLTYTAMAGAVTVFTLTLNSDGTYSFTLAAPVDHALNSNDLTLNFQVIATDFDGDSDSIVLPVKINDDKPYFTNVQGLYVHENDLPQGSDTDKEPVTVNGQFQLVQGADTVASFALDSSVNPVQGLTSNGVAVTLSAPVDDGHGNLTYTAMAGAVTVFTLTLNTDGTYSFTLAAPVDHALNSNDLTLNFKVIATDFDGDSDSIVLPVKINDDKPYFTNVQGLYVHENDLPQGSDTDKEPVTVNGQFQLVQGADTVSSFALDSSVNPVQGLTSNGVAVTLSAPVDDGNGNLTYTAMAGAVTVFTLTLNSDGTYSFTLSAPVDHALNSDSLTLNFKVIATDFDGDSDSIVLPVKINDDKPSFIHHQPLSVNEDDLPQGSDGSKESLSASGQFTVVQGADQVVSYQLDSSVNPVQGLTSNGVSVVLSAPVDDGNGNLTYTATAGGNPIFTLVLNTDGSYTFTLSGPIDHASGSDSKQLNFKVLAVDFDGDKASVNLPVTIIDDKPTITAVQALSVDEDDLAQGSDTTKESLTATGHFTTTQGADHVVSYTLNLTTNPLAGVTSGGQVLTLSDSVDASGNHTYTATKPDGTLIFTLQLNANGSYQFTLSGPLDHAASRDELLLNFNVVATDYDGDTSSIVLPVTVVDDQPSVISAQALSVNEDDLASGTDQTKESTTANGQFTTTQGADGIAHYQIDTSVISNTGLTSQGQPVVWGAPSITTTSSGQVYTYQGIANGVVIFTLVLRADGSYSFTLNGAVDHPVNADQLTLNIPVLAQDADGDTSPITLPVTIVDDVPILHDKNIALQEGSVASSVNLFSRDNNLSPDTQGADRGVITHFSAVDEAGRDIQFREGSVLSNDIELNGAAKTVTVVEIVNGVSRDLGTLTIQPNGTATFTPVTQLDHTDGNDIKFTVDVTATDYDHDTSTEQLNITISDHKATITQQKFTGYEDQGHDAALNLVPAGEQSNAQDNLGGLPVEALKLALQVNLYDVDQGESLGEVSIWNPNSIHGDFYYLDGSNQLVKLDVDPATGHVILPAAMLQQSINGTIATVENLYFVPERHYSTANGGMNASVSVEILQNGVRDHFTNGNMRIEIESVADIATWSSSEFHYDAVEDASNVSLNIAAETQDNSNPEAITYQIRFTENGANANLVYSDGSPIPTKTDANGTYYEVPANKIAQVQVDPADNFAGQIKLDVTAITKESTNYVAGKQTAQSETKEIVIDVAPEADRGSFTVNRISIFEDNASNQNAVDPSVEHDHLLLSEVISMTGSSDADGSEALFVRLSDFTDTGATLVWLGSGPSPITVGTYPNGETYYEIPQSALSQVEVLPTKHSNENFSFVVEGIVKDTVNLSTGQVQDIESLGSKTVNVTVKGVADLPNIDFISGNTQWQSFNDGTHQGVMTTVAEDSLVDLNFSIISGEIADSPTDSSETISVLLSNIPDGVTLFDSDGTSVDLVFAGYDSNHKPIYQANLTVAQVVTGIQVQPVASSTANIDIKATVIVTENDGHVRQVEETIRILVEPKIDVTENYHNAVSGNEDDRIHVTWVPQNTPGNIQNPDAQEYFSRVEISGFPDGSRVFVNNVEVTLVNGVLVLEPVAGQSDLDFSNQVSAAGYIQVIPPHNSSTDFTLSTAITVKEQDHEYVDAGNPGQGIAEEVIHGSIGVKVNPIAEPDGQLLVENAGSVAQTVQADANGKIDFTINDASGGQAGTNVIRFDNLDSNTAGSYQSDELVDQLVVSFGNVPQEVLNQLLITGAINNGDGTWTITNEADFSIKAPNGLVYNSNNDPDNNGFNDIKITITAKVYDQGEDSSEVKITKQVSTELTLSFPTVVTGNNSVAAQLNWVGDADDLVIGKEDNAVDLGQQIQDKLMVNATGFDAVADELSIVINASDLPAGASIGGQDFNFVDGQYVFKGTLNPDGSISGLEGLVLIPPRDFAGDFKLPITFVTTDTQSGDEKTLTAQVPVAISPVVDVPSSSGDQPLDNHVTPSITLNVQETLGLDANHQPTDLANDTPTQDGIAYEDGIVHLNLAIGLADSLNGSTQGQEVLTEVTLTLNDTNAGVFVDANGQSLGASITLTQAELPAALGEIYFKPAPNYPSGNDINTVGITVTGKVTDSTVFDETNASSQGVSSSDADKTFTSQVSFEVKPVVDDITIGSGSPISVTGDEDSWIALADQGSAFNVSLNDNDGSEQFVSLVLTGLPTDFLVKSLSSDYVVKNNGGGEWSVQIRNPNLTSLDLSALAIKPAKDFSGEVQLGIKVFTQESLLGEPVEHTGQFTLNVTPVGDDVDIAPITNVVGNEGQAIDISLGAQILDKAPSLPGGATYTENSPETLRVEISGVPDGAFLSLADGTLGTSLGGGVWVFEINAQQLDKVVFNSGDNNQLNWNGNLHFKVQSVDTGLAGDQHLGSAQEFDVHVDVTAVNDRPELINVQDQVTEEDTPLLLNSFTLADIDAQLDDPNADYTLQIGVNSGVLIIDSSLSSGLTIQGDGTGALSITGNVAEINAAIGAGLVKFVPSPDFYGQVAVTLNVNDNGNAGIEIAGDASTAHDNSAQFVIDVTAVNDKPEVDGIHLTAQIDEASGQKLTGITVSDVDYAGSHTNDVMKVTLSISEGILSVQAPAGSSVAVSYALDGSVILEGSPEAINALLNHSDSAYGLFVDAAVIAGTQINLTVTAQDMGVYFENASGMALEESKTYPIQINPVANAPSLSMNPAFGYAQQIYANQSVSAQGIALLGAIAALTDLHETLSLRVDHLPAGASLSSTAGSVTDLGNGRWEVSPDALESLKVVGLEEGVHTLSLTALSTESDGSSAPSTNSIDYQIEIAADGSLLDHRSATDDSLLVADNSGMTLLSGSGDDFVQGGAGDDVLVGGLGADILVGGTGADMFKWTLDGVDDKVDHIRDFNVSEGDSIDLIDVVQDLGNHLTMEQLLNNLSVSNQLTAQVVDNDVTLQVTTDNQVQQTIVIENLATQIDFTGMSSLDIIGTLLDQNLLRHD
ncbi:retention module-containing protein [Vibrio cholerae]|uniref:retention module-containing protein n=1 Tax=Vibrio cholerae TaxID=666 RepID=UPI0022F33037|nr:retention module-containing protein [Vibrio cholerae]MDA5313652.1 retention module-containing protein [Vibrio cholerae]MDN6969914.1 retention module-containing protein [Vibrio cholerae]